MAGDFVSSSTHPPLPPTTEDIRYAHLRLLRSRRVGASTFHRLLTEHGTAQNALMALPDVARAAGVKDYELCPEQTVLTELKAGQRMGARLLLHGYEGYPSCLMNLADAPPVLWALGDPDLLSRPMIALVGARNASSLGMRMAKAVARDLGEAGFVVVSGLARGIDAAAHHASLPTGTIAVMAGGIDMIYPAENTQLADQIAKQGLRISEQPMGMQPIARHFPARNRIVAGLGRACVVIEAGAKSGSLITARDALDLGRDVLAVPGHPFDARASGCNILIRDGATLVRGAEDIVESLAPISPSVATKLTSGDAVNTPLSAQERVTPSAPVGDLPGLVLERLGPTPMPEDDLIRELAAPPDQLSPVLTDLELHGKIHRHSGGLLSRAS